ncbi:hypothetical protein H8D29_02500 [PVC group bacterium]|nr:hypothetical protein [PVC group bacterium]
MADRCTQSEGHLVGRHLLIGLTGGIACYKVASLVSSLIQIGSTVDVIMTQAATRFIAPLTFEALTGRQVITSQWSQGSDRNPNHIQLASSADAMLIAPCTMDMLAKLANGMTDDPVSLVISAINKETTPVLLAPSMNSVMFSQAVTQRNLATLSNDGFTIIDPDDGWQACRSIGKGRLPDPERLFEALAVCFG